MAEANINHLSVKSSVEMKKIDKAPIDVIRSGGGSSPIREARRHETGLKQWKKSQLKSKVAVAATPASGIQTARNKIEVNRDSALIETRAATSVAKPAIVMASDIAA